MVFYVYETFEESTEKRKFLLYADLWTLY